MRSRVFRAAFPINVALPKVKTDEASEEASKTIENKSTESSEEQRPKVDSATKKKKKKNKTENVEKAVIPCHPSDKFPRTDLLLSPSQMIEEGYAVPIGEMAYKYPGYVYTKDHYTEVSVCIKILLLMSHNNKL